MTNVHLVVMGVAGCGKSTVAEELARRLGWELAEGDDFHPEANIAKMSSGTPLTDEDRWPWLDLIAEWTAEQDGAGKNTVVTCSALGVEGSASPLACATSATGTASASAIREAETRRFTFMEGGPGKRCLPAATPLWGRRSDRRQC